MVGSVNESEDSFTDNTTENYFNENDAEDLEYSDYEEESADYYDEEYEETELIQESNNSIFYTISEVFSTFISSGGLDLIINLSSGSSVESSSDDENNSSQRNNSGSRNYSEREK